MVIFALQLMKYEGFVPEDDGELSLFDAGVSVGVGIGLSICLCIGIGTCLYKTTARNFKKLLWWSVIAILVLLSNSKNIVNACHVYILCCLYG